MDRAHRHFAFKGRLVRVDAQSANSDWKQNLMTGTGHRDQGWPGKQLHLFWQLPVSRASSTGHVTY